MMQQVKSSVRMASIPFGRISSSNNTTVNIQNTIDGEIRDLKVVAPYGIASCPVDGLFAQMIINGNDNNVCVGVNNQAAPPTKSGETVLYSSGGATVKLGIDGSIAIGNMSGASVGIDKDGNISIYGKKVHITQWDDD